MKNDNKTREVDKDRLIGDCMEVNSSIITYRHEDVKLKFIRKIMANHYTDRLIKIVNKLKESHTTLTRNNMYEYFIYISNNYPPNGCYKNTKAVKVLEHVTVVAYQVGDIKCRFLFNDDSDTVSINMAKKLKDDKTNHYEVHVLELTHKDHDINNILKEVNEALLEDITGYIISVIESTRGGDENDV